MFMNVKDVSIIKTILFIKTTVILNQYNLHIGRDMCLYWCFRISSFSTFFRQKKYETEWISSYFSII